MPLAIQPDLLFFGGPTSLTVDGEEAGTTFDPPKITVEYETNADKIRPQGAPRPIKGLLFVKSAICKVVFRVYEFKGSKFTWVLPGAEVTGTTQLTVQPQAGRMPSSAYKNVVMEGVGLDGLPLLRRARRRDLGRQPGDPVQRRRLVELRGRAHGYG